MDTREVPKEALSSPRMVKESQGLRTSCCSGGNILEGREWALPAHNLDQQGLTLSDTRRWNPLAPLG